MEDKDKLRTVPFTEENGGIVDMYVLEETTLQGIQYIIVTEELEDESEDAVVMIMREEKREKEASKDDKDEFAVYEIVENEDELQAVAGVFAELMEDVDFEL